MSYFPAFINVAHCRVAVVGGGSIAERKVDDLLQAGALHVTVISPDLTPSLVELAAAGRIEARMRQFEDGDCTGATIVIAATDDSEIQQQVWQQAHASGALVNTVDRPELCDFIVPAVMRRDSVTVAVSTGGNSPVLATWLRDRIAEFVGPEYGALAALLGKNRSALRRRLPDWTNRAKAIRAVMNSEMLNHLRAGNAAAAEEQMDQVLRDYERNEVFS